ncbi:unnamed protein product [Arabis nemorensis]|uniref:Uncharacterized protein n=1 Tax=Arabis nemorensis TaxID=586526 RepID=A0A565CX81_9BRAS|nr:unnamed protein product [Arabis nemorensis]
MAVSFPRLPRWLCGGNSKERDKKESITPKGSSSLNPSLKKNDPEWSIGWVEPHGPGFKSEDDDDCGGFVVLVPCYKKVLDGSGNLIPTNGFFSPPAPDGKSMEQWLSSMGKL